MKKSAQWQPDDQSDLLQFIGGLPPVEMARDATTEDQRENVKTLLIHYQLLRDSLQAYFSGQKSPIEDRQLRTSVEADLKFYLGFYDLVWFGWREIQAEVQSSELTEVFPYQQPGDLLKGLLFWECITCCEVITSNSFSPNKRELMALLDGKELLANQRNGVALKRLERTLEYGREAFGNSGVAPKLSALCEFAIKKRLRGNSTLRDALENYRKTKKKRSKATQKLLRGSI